MPQQNRQLDTESNSKAEEAVSSYIMPENILTIFISLRALNLVSQSIRRYG